MIQAPSVMDRVASVYKYEIHQHGSVTALDLPRGSRVVDFRMQTFRYWSDSTEDYLYMWVYVPDTRGGDLVERRFTIYGTGYDIDPDMTYIRTCHIADKGLVLHLFEIPSSIWKSYPPVTY